MKIFKEEQRFTQWWVWFILIGIISVFLMGNYSQFILKTPFGNNPMSNSGLLIVTVVLTLLVVLFRFLTLKTIIDNNGIQYRFYPFEKKFHTIKWEDIESINVVKIRPIRDFGGWGIRGNCYSVKGNKAIQIYLKNNTKLFIGTQKETQVQEVIKRYSNLNNENI